MAKASGRNNQMPRPRRTAKPRAEQDLSHAGEEIGLPREPSHGVELGACPTTPASDKRPWLGRMPKMPQKLAGMRTDPPVSVPIAKLDEASATAAADPLDEPPGTRPGALGLVGAP